MNPMPANCPICERACELVDIKLDAKRYNCARCGEFSLTGSLVATLPALLRAGENNRALLSHAVRRMQSKSDRPPMLDTEIINKIAENEKLPTPFEQANNLILWIGDSSLQLSSPGRSLTLDYDTRMSVTGSRSKEEFEFVVSALIRKNILEGKQLPGGGMAQVMLSFDGWQHYYKIKNETVATKKAFMAMKFGDQLLDKMFREEFKPAVALTGYELFRVDEDNRAGLIDDKLRVNIRMSRFLIAELTHDNRGAYWEAGFAEGLGKPVIYLCRETEFKQQGTHFDTNHHLTVLWDENNIRLAIDSLKATIRATLPSEAKLTDD